MFRTSLRKGAWTPPIKPSAVDDGNPASPYRSISVTEVYLYHTTRFPMNLYDTTRIPIYLYCTTRIPTHLYCTTRFPILLVYEVSRRSRRIFILKSTYIPFKGAL